MVKSVGFELKFDGPNSPVSYCSLQGVEPPF